MTIFNIIIALEAARSAQSYLGAVVLYARFRKSSARGGVLQATGAST